MPANIQAVDVPSLGDTMHGRSARSVNQEVDVPILRPCGEQPNDAGFGRVGLEEHQVRGVEQVAAVILVGQPVEVWPQSGFVLLSEEDGAKGDRRASGDAADRQRFAQGEAADKGRKHDTCLA
jgi:hypothetical protein